MEESTQQSSPQKSGGSKMMIVSVIVVVLILLGVGGYYVMNKNTTKSDVETTMMPKASPTSSSMFSSIQDALSKSLSLQCEYTDPQTGAKTTAYIKAGAIRADVTTKTAGDTNSFIMKNKTIWFWTGKKGMTMAFDPKEMMKNMPSVSPLPKPSGTMMPSASGGSDMMANLEKFREACKPATVSDAALIPPADVVFTDVSKMMPSGGAMMPKVSGVPAAPSGISQEQMQEMQKQMMQKYGASQSPSEK